MRGRPDQWMSRFFALPLMLGGLLFLMIAGSSAEDNEDLVIYLIRHAEQTDSTAFDPPLSEKGRARARWYADYFADRGLTRIYSSPFQRTRQTVAPLAEKLGLEVGEYDPRNLPAFAGELKTMTGVVLVSGHSNTTPALVNALIGEVRFVNLLHFQYDYIFRVSWDKAGKAQITIKHSKP